MFTKYTKDIEWRSAARSAAFWLPKIGMAYRIIQSLVTFNLSHHQDTQLSGPLGMIVMFDSAPLNRRQASLGALWGRSRNVPELDWYS